MFAMAGQNSMQMGIDGAVGVVCEVHQAENRNKEVCSTFHFGTLMGNYYSLWRSVGEFITVYFSKLYL